jgi:hypothetical protein
MITTRQETSDNTKNKIDEKSSSLHSFFSFISQDTKQLSKMQQDNPSSEEKLNRQKIDDDAIMNDVDADEIEMKRELAVLREKRRLAHLRQKLEQIRIDKTLRFLVVTLSIRSRQENELQKEKMFKIVDSKRYKNTKQHDLNIFVRECQKAFDIRLLTYALNKDKILYAQRFLNDTSAKD